MRRDIVVVGGSAGAVEALGALLSRLHPSIRASILVVVHIPSAAVSLLPKILSRKTQLRVRHPTDGERLEHGSVYIAPPNYHLLVERGRVRVVHGPRENGHRPAVDPLFRSAALSYGSRVIGVVLSGNLSDGSAGLSAIKHAGGVALAQSLDDAQYPGMPRSAAEAVELDRRATASDLAGAIAELTSEPIASEEQTVTEEIDKEVAISALQADQLHGDDQPGRPSAFACPECSGVLWELDDERLLRFRCRVGHAYTPESLVVDHGHALETAFWTALRTLEEGASVARRVSDRARTVGNARTAERFLAREKALLGHAERIREALLSGILDAQPLDDAEL